MFIPGLIELVLIFGLLLFVGYFLLRFFWKKDRESQENRRGKLLGCTIGLVILVGIGIGLFKLSNPPFTKNGAFAIEATTEFPKGATKPGYLSYQLRTYRGALIIDAWSLRIVFPDRAATGFLTGSRQKEGGKRLPRRSSWLMTQSMGESTVTFEWVGQGAFPDESNGGGVLTITIDEVGITIKDGIANIGGFQVPVTGPLQVVFLDPLGGFDEVRPREVEKAFEGEEGRHDGDGSGDGGG